MRVTLVTSPHVRHVAVLERDFEPHSNLMYSFVPVGLLSLVAAIRTMLPHVDCALYDLNKRIRIGALDLDEYFYDSVAEDLLADRADVYGFMTECDSYHHVLQICEALKRRRPDAGIVLGGPHASAVARQTMERC